MKISQDTHKPTRHWIGAAARAPGTGHIARNIPCQDRASAQASSLPVAIVLDGRGSAKHSELGAEAGIKAIEQFLQARQEQFSALLSQPASALTALQWQVRARELYLVAVNAQVEQAQAMDSPVKEFEFTLSCCMVGELTAAWISVGDSPMVVNKYGVRAQLTQDEASEYAGQTEFVSATQSCGRGIKCGLFSADGIRSVIVMSDGTATRLITEKEQVPAKANDSLTEHMRHHDGYDLAINSFINSNFWGDFTRDDRSIAILTLIEGNKIPKAHTPLDDQTFTSPPKLVQNTPIPNTVTPEKKEETSISQGSTPSPKKFYFPAPKSKPKQLLYPITTPSCLHYS